MLDQDSFDKLIRGSYKENPHAMKKDEVKQEVDEEEAFEILAELIDVMRNHNLSYSCAYKIALSFSYALTTGAIELYNQEVIEELD